MKDVEIAGVSVIDADCYIEPALSASRKIIDRFGKGQKLAVSRSDSRAKNPFPKEWRMHAFYVDALPILNESGSVMTEEAELPAHLDLIQKLRASDEKTTLLFTGPLTDLSRALEADPDIEEKIEKLVWMGGTFLSIGNVEEPEHDGSAEWNAYWDPEAVDAVWRSGIDIEMVVLESTNKVPLTIETRMDWAKKRSFVGLDFVGQCYAACPPLVHFQTNSTYYLWDVLTTLSLGRPEIGSRLKLNSIVHASGPSQGKVEFHYEGRPVEVLHDVHAEKFYSYIEELAKSASEYGEEKYEANHH